MAKAKLEYYENMVSNMSAMSPQVWKCKTIHTQISTTVYNQVLIQLSALEHFRVKTITQGFTMQHKIKTRVLLVETGAVATAPLRHCATAPLRHCATALLSGSGLPCSPL